MEATTLSLRDQPIFICGHPKAGTSLLRAVLDSHPQLVVYPEESGFFRRFLPLATGKAREQQLTLAEEQLIHIFTWNRHSPPPSQAGFLDRDYSHISFEIVRQEMRRLVAENYRDERDLLSAAVLAFGLANGQAVSGSGASPPRHWVEKSPYNEYYAARIFSWWPEARCIHILRDPRDNFLSYRRKHTSWSPEFFAANWNRSTLAGFSNEQQYGKDHYFLLRYEDLVTQPTVKAQELMSFLQIDWDAALAAPTRAGQQWQGNSMFSQPFARTDGSVEISAAPVARWKDQLAPEEALILQSIARSGMAAAGYPPAAFPGNSLAIVRSTWRTASWSLRRRIASLLKKPDSP